MTLADAKEWATIVGVIVAVVSLAVAAFNTRLTLKTNRARLWLDLRSAFSAHDEVHRKLRPGGDWSEGVGPDTIDDYAKVEAYMGLFEHCESLLKEKLIDEKTFREIYSYRLKNLLANCWVRSAKLNDRPEGWERFIALIKRMQMQPLLPERARTLVA